MRVPVLACVLACSTQKAPESPATEGAASADAGVSAQSPSAPALGDAPAGETLFVRGALADCEAEGARKCLVVRGSASEPWRNLYAPIEGFEHDPAYDYELRVEVVELAGAPPDAPTRRYRLLQVVSQQPAAAR